MKKIPEAAVETEPETRRTLMNYVPFFSTIMGSSTSTKRKSQTLGKSDGTPESTKQTPETSETLENNYATVSLDIL